ncbi:MAG: hypothetical protein CUN55_10140 [Phototrophicales bacterium]|nr:MAG: hypothetical protein CUN55_10140 [Phototrophicales bacterium]
MWWRLCAMIMLILMLVVGTAYAQDGSTNTQTYENTQLGIVFELPDGWTEESINNRLTLGTPTELERIRAGLPPQNLVVSVVMGTYTDLRLTSASDIINRVRQLVPSGISAPDPYTVTYGESINGYETQFVIEDSAIMTRVSLLTATDGRVAIIRGIGPVATWETIQAPLLDAILNSVQFIPTENMVDPLSSINDSDGGVQWHYQLLQGRDQLPVEIGGIAIDSSGVVYVAAGPRGFLALEKDTGDFINVLGPIFADDNFVDVDLSPDERLYFANANNRSGLRVVITDRAGNFLNTFGSGGDASGEFAPNMPRTIAITARGDVWLVSEGHAEPPTNRLYRFDLNGNLLSAIDLDTVSPNLANVRLAVNRTEDRIYVIGEQGGFHVLSWSGEVIARNLSRPFLDAAVPTDITISPFNGNLIIATRNEGFLLMSPQGVVLDRFGYLYDAERGGRFYPGEYLFPKGIATTTDGWVFFGETNSDTGFAQVQAFTFVGEGRLPIPQRTPPITDTPNFTTELASGGDIRFGVSVRGELNNNSNRHDYTFFAEAGDRITITMRKVNPDGILDTWLFLYDSNYNELAQNDDVTQPIEGLTETDSLITFTIPSNGSYIVRATRFGGNGIYELVVTRE